MMNPDRQAKAREAMRGRGRILNGARWLHENEVLAVVAALGEPKRRTDAEDVGLRIAERIRQEMTSGRQWWLDALSPPQREEYEADLRSTCVAVCELEFAALATTPTPAEGDYNPDAPIGRVEITPEINFALQAALMASTTEVSTPNPSGGYDGGENAKYLDQLEAMVAIQRRTLLAVRDWQGEQNPAGNTYRTPIGFKGSPFDYLRKLANDGLRESAKIAWGVATLPVIAPGDERMRGVASEMLTTFAEGVVWNDEKRAAYEALSAALDPHTTSGEGA